MLTGGGPDLRAGKILPMRLPRGVKAYEQPSGEIALWDGERHVLIGPNKKGLKVALAQLAAARAFPELSDLLAAVRKEAKATKPMEEAWRMADSEVVKLAPKPAEIGAAGSFWTIRDALVDALRSGWVEAGGDPERCADIVLAKLSERQLTIGPKLLQMGHDGIIRCFWGAASDGEA